MRPRLLERYRKDVVPKLSKEFSYQFCLQWLGIAGIRSAMPFPDLFPHYYKLNDPAESHTPHVRRNGHSNGNGNGNGSGNGNGNGRSHESRVRGIWADRGAATEPAPAAAVEEPSLEL